MTKFEARPAQVPVELQPLIDEQFLAAQERWQNASFEDVLPDRPALEAISIGDERVLVSRLTPKDSDGSAVALSFPFLQGLNDTMLLRAAFMQQSVMPNTEVLLFPNIHAGKNQTYTLSAKDKQRLEKGSLAPIAEKYIRV